MSRRMTLLHTNDIHSDFEQWTRLAGMIRSERAAASVRGEPVLYVDSGDHQDRSAPISEGTAGRANLALLAQAGCEAATWGNGEIIGCSPDRVSDLARDAAYPILMANLGATGLSEPLPGVRGWTILERGGAQVGLFGLTVPFTEAYAALGLTVSPFRETATQAVRELRASGCDLVVCLSHLGLFLDRKLARLVPGIDVICGAHTHHLLEVPELVGETRILQCGRGTHLGVLRLELARVGGVAAASSSVLPAASAVPDPGALAVLAGQQVLAGAALEEVVAEIPTPIPHALDGLAPLAEAVAVALRQRLQTDLALVNTGIFMHGVKAGPLTRGELLALCPSYLHPAAIQLTGQEVAQVMTQARTDACIYYRIWAGARGEYIGTLVGAGPLGQLVPHKTYTVATLGFLALGYSGYEGLRKQEIRWEMGSHLREVVLEVLQRWPLLG